MSDTVVIRTAASEAVGHGHVARGLALAAEARSRGLVVRFKAEDEVTAKVLASYGEYGLYEQLRDIPAFIIRDLPDNNDQIEVRAEVAAGSTVMLLDDTGPARTQASLVVDAMMTPDRSALLAHDPRVRYLYGLEYAALRREIADYAGMARPGTEERPRLAISLGGGFDDQLPRLILEALHAQGFDGHCEVLLTQSGADLGNLQEAANQMGAQVQIRTPAVGDVFARADLVITKIGISLLEAFAVGVGCVLLEPGIAHRDVENALARSYQPWPAVETGLYDDSTVERVTSQAMTLLPQPGRLRTMGEEARQLVDGRGAERVVDALLAPAR